MLQVLSKPQTKSLPYRLLFLQTTTLAETFGGIEYYLDDLATDLATVLGEKNVQVIAPERTLKNQTTEKPSHFFPTHFIPFKHRGLLKKIQNRFSRKMWNKALEIVRAENPTHLVCGHVKLSPFVYLLSIRTGLPYVTCTYGIECWGDLNWLEEFSLSQSDKILTISEWTKNILRNKGYPEHQIQVVSPRLPTELETLTKPEFKSSKTPSNEPLRILTVSRLEKTEQYKGQDHVLQALHQILEKEKTLPFEYWIVGDGTDLPRLKELAGKLSLEKHVKFIPPVKDRASLVSLYKQCQLYVMPSRYGKWAGKWKGEGFGIVYLEAAACGLPSVAYNCGGATDIIRHEKTGLLIEPDKTDSLANELWNLHLNRPQIQQLGQNAYQDVMQRFTRPAIQKQILNWLHQLG